MKEYRVLAQSDSFWRDRFDPLRLQDELNRLARDGWRVITCTSADFTGFGGLGTKRHELFVLLERDAAELPAASATGPRADDTGYDSTKIPAQRFYADVGNISSALQSAGLVTREQMNRAREEFAARGGHLCDHLLALGFVEEDALRAFLAGS